MTVAFRLEQPWEMLLWWYALFFNKMLCSHVDTRLQKMTAGALKSAMNCGASTLLKSKNLLLQRRIRCSSLEPQ